MTLITVKTENNGGNGNNALEFLHVGNKKLSGKFAGQVATFYSTSQVHKVYG